MLNASETAVLDAISDYLKVRSFEHHDCSSCGRERSALDVVLTALATYVEEQCQVPADRSVRAYLNWRSEKIGG